MYTWTHSSYHCKKVTFGKFGKTISKLSKFVNNCQHFQNVGQVTFPRHSDQMSQRSQGSISKVSWLSERHGDYQDSQSDQKPGRPRSLFRGWDFSSRRHQRLLRKPDVLSPCRLLPCRSSLEILATLRMKSWSLTSKLNYSIHSQSSCFREQSGGRGGGGSKVHCGSC